MNNVSRVKVIKIFLSILGLIIFSTGIFLYALLWNSSYDTPKVKVSSTLVDEIMLAQKQGKTLEIDNDKFNQLLSMYIKPNSFSGVTIKGVHGEITGEYVKFNILAAVKGVNLFLSSQGSLSYKDNKIQYKPFYFKVGKITLPKSFIVNKLKTYSTKGMSIEDDSIHVDKSVIPVKIQNVYAKNNKLFIVVEKTANNLDQQAKSALEKENNPEKNSSGNLNFSNAGGDSAGGDTSSDIGQNSSKNSSDNAEMDAALNRINSGLSLAIASVSSENGKSVISQVMSVVNSMKGDPNANPYEYSGSVRASYSKLSPSEKAELKSAVFSNVNGNDINIVSKILGK